MHAPQHRLRSDLLALIVAALAVAAVIPGISGAPIGSSKWARYRAPRIGVQAPVSEAPVYQNRSSNRSSSSFPLASENQDVIHAPLRRVDLPENVDAFMVCQLNHPGGSFLTHAFIFQALEYHVSLAEKKYSQLRRRSAPSEVPLHEAATLRRRGVDVLDDAKRPPESRREVNLPHGRIGAQLPDLDVTASPRSTLLAVQTPNQENTKWPPLFESDDGTMVMGTAASTSTPAPLPRSSHLPSRSFSTGTASVQHAAHSARASDSSTTARKNATAAPAYSNEAGTATISVAPSLASSSAPHERFVAGKPSMSLSSVSRYSPLELAAAKAGNLTKASGSVPSESLPLDIEGNDVGYVATLQIGSKSKSFRFLIDSGSADTWIPGGKCGGCGQGHARLANADSDTLKHHPSRSVNVRYGTGQMSGTLASDTLAVAGMQVHNFTFALARKTSVEFNDPSVPFDGLMGLAKQSLCTYGAPTPIDALHLSGAVSAPVMGYRLGRVSDGRKHNDGVVSFGGVDGSAIKGSLVEVPNVSKSGFWETKLDQITINGTDLHLNGRTAILDTGTSLLILPSEDAQVYHNAIPDSQPDGQGGWTVPCTTSASLALTVGGTKFPIDARDLTWLPVDKSNLTGRCVSAVSGGGSDNQWLVGATFLKNVYFATNADKNTIGLAHLA